MNKNLGASAGVLALIAFAVHLVTGPSSDKRPAANLRNRLGRKRTNHRRLQDKPAQNANLPSKGRGSLLKPSFIANQKVCRVSRMLLRVVPLPGATIEAMHSPSHCK